MWLIKSIRIIENSVEGVKGTGARGSNHMNDGMLLWFWIFHLADVIYVINDYTYIHSDAMGSASAPASTI